MREMISTSIMLLVFGWGAAAGLFLLFPAPLSAEDVAGTVVREGVQAAFKEFERQMISRYFREQAEFRKHDEGRGQEGDSGKKKSKKKGMPPGIAKKLERGGTLPPGIAKRDLPDDLARELPPPPPGYERTIVGSDVALVEIDTGRIADIITDAVLGEE